VGLGGLIAFTRGDLGEAWAEFKKALDLAHQVREPAATAHTIMGLMSVACHHSRMDLAARLQGAAECQLELVEVGVMAVASAQHQLYVATIKRALGEDQFRSAVNATRRLSPDEAVAFALQA
jgi:hypothetical protein